MRNVKLITGLLALSLGAAYALPRYSTQDDEPTPVQEAMGGLQSGQRAMRRMVKDPAANKDALVKTLREMQRHAHTIFTMPPTVPEGLATTTPEEWRIDFQRQFLEVLDCLLEVELAVHKGDADAVAKGYTKLGELKKTGHDTYQ